MQIFAKTTPPLKPSRHLGPPPRLKQTLVIASALIALFALVVTFHSSAKAAACTALPTDKGTAATTFTVASAGTYRLWAHVHVPAAGGSAFDLAVDGACPMIVDGGSLPVSTFHWIGTTSGSSAPISVNLTTGTHTLSLAGTDPNVGVDQILLLASASCVPTGDGSNCQTGAAASTGQTPGSPNAGLALPIPKLSAATLKLTAYVAVGAVITALLALVLLRALVKTNNPLWRRLLATKSPAPPPSQAQSPAVPTLATGLPGLQAPATLPNRKRITLLALAFGIVGGLITLAALADTDANIVINLAGAKAASPAQVVPYATAIGGAMVLFGGATSSSQSTTKTPAPKATPRPTSSTPKPSTPTPSSGSTSGSTPVKPLAGVSCNYQTDTWSGDASGVGYSITKVSNSDGNPASFSVKLNANRGTTEVVGYPSDQCLMYSALPATLSSSFNVTPPAASSGLDYEFAYDIWLTTASAATSNNWNNDLELMIWNYNNGQTPAGSVKSTLSDGSKVWVDQTNNTSGTVSVVLPGNETSGTVNIAGIVSQLKSLGYVSSTFNGILDVEYGIEAPYGGGQTFTVNSMSVGN